MVETTRLEQKHLVQHIRTMVQKMCCLGNLNYNDNIKLGIDKGRIMYVYIRKLYNFKYLLLLF